MPCFLLLLNNLWDHVRSPCLQADSKERVNCITGPVLQAEGQTRSKIIGSCCVCGKTKHTSI
jgi:hypothetical protein